MIDPFDFKTLNEEKEITSTDIRKHNTRDVLTRVTLHATYYPSSLAERRRRRALNSLLAAAPQDHIPLPDAVA